MSIMDKNNSHIAEKKEFTFLGKSFLAVVI